MRETSVRPMRPGDLSALADIWLQGNLDAHPFIHPSYWSGYLPQVRTLLPQAEVLVWEEEGAPAGFLGLDGDYIAGIFVTRTRRSQGIGKRLLDGAKSRRERLSLSVYEKNAPALRFYTREGFRPLEQRTDEATGEREQLLVWEQAPAAFCYSSKYTSASG